MDSYEQRPATAPHDICSSDLDSKRELRTTSPSTDPRRHQGDKRKSKKIVTTLRGLEPLASGRLVTETGNQCASHCATRSFASANWRKLPECVDIALTTADRSFWRLTSTPRIGELGVLWASNRLRLSYEPCHCYEVSGVRFSKGHLHRVVGHRNSDQECLRNSA